MNKMSLIKIAGFKSNLMERIFIFPKQRSYVFQTNEFSEKLIINAYSAVDNALDSPFPKKSISG